jgi:uncharacterized RDD family membrane protein YckC
MKKQVSYPKLIPRLFSTTLDLFILSIILPFIMMCISRTLYVIVFRDFLTEQQINWLSFNVDNRIFFSSEFLGYVETHHKMSLYFLCISLLSIINFGLMGVYFISFWKYKGATPGKIIMRMKIVDTQTLQAPKTSQLIKRFFSYLIGLIGIWFIIFTKRNQALHDKIAGTIVIKA